MNPPSTFVQPSAPAAAAPAGMKLEDILYAVFRHKWKIVICSVLGLAGAVAYHFLKPPPFQSEAMLFIRYVMEDSSPNLPGSDSRAISPDQRGETIMATEIQILSSVDIADEVADAVSPEKILAQAKGPKDRPHAAAVVRGGLVVQPLPGSSVIHLIFKNSDPSIVQPVLTAVVDTYLKKHVEIHNGHGVYGDFLSQETDQLRSRLSETEDELRKAKDKAGIVSLDDSKHLLTEQIAKIREDIFAAQAELAERTSMLQEVAKQGGGPASAGARKSADSAGAPAESALPVAVFDQYREIRMHLETMQKNEEDLLTQFTEQSARVKAVRAQIADADKQRQALEQKYPQLLRMGLPAGATAAATPGMPTTPAFDWQGEMVRLAGLRTKIKVLNDQLEQMKAEAAKVDQMEGSISELQRTKELEEANYKYYSVHLEAARIDETLGAGRALNIAEIQTPTPPAVDQSKTRKTMGMIAAAGVGAGIAWALMIELLIDHSIRKPSDVINGLRVPLFLSVPDFGKKGHANTVFHDTLRDRLVGYFENRGMTHKPKLVAVTGVGRGAGVTTTAAGLAQSLSHTGDSNVLLVDMTQTQGSSKQFYKGKEACGLDQLLDTRNDAQIDGKLYVVGEELNSDKLSRALPTRFNQLVPKLKASDFDYIIFDMPPVNQISITPRLASFMDMVLLVVESEHTDREIAKQAAQLLAESKAHVGAVLNKARNYLPSKAQHDFLGTPA